MTTVRASIAILAAIVFGVPAAMADDDGSNYGPTPYVPTYDASAWYMGELAEKGLGGAVYTQTTDVEVEINGIMTYDRKVLKFDPAALKAVHARVLQRAEAAARPPESAQ